MKDFDNTLIGKKHGLILGTTQSGKTYKVSELIQAIPHHVIFINTQYESRPMEFCDAIVQNNNEVISALENGSTKICINYSLNWYDKKANLVNVDQLIQLIFSVAETNPDKFKVTIIIDELDNYVTQHNCSAPIDNLFNRGLRFGISGIGIGHDPAGVHNKIKGACSWYLHFELSDEALLYYKNKSTKLYHLKYGNYEGYYREKSKLWLFSQNAETKESGLVQEDNLRQEQLHTENQLDNNDNPPDRQDMDSNV